MEVQEVTVSDLSGVFPGQLQLTLGGFSTRCFAPNASELEVETKLEELPGIDSISVKYESVKSSSTKRVYTITYDGFKNSNGDVAELAYALCLYPSVAVDKRVTVAIRTVSQGSAHNIPEVYMIKTTPNLPPIDPHSAP